MPTLAVLLAVLLAVATEEDEYQLLDFHASWCGPCKTLDERMKDDKVKAVLKKHKIKVVRIDIDEDKEAATDYKIETVPTLILVKVNDKKEAKVLKRKSGLQDISALVKFVNPDEKD